MVKTANFIAKEFFGSFLKIEPAAPIDIHKNGTTARRPASLLPVKVFFRNILISFIVIKLFRIPPKDQMPKLLQSLLRNPSVDVPNSLQ